MSQENITPENVQTLIPVASPLVQVTGGQKYQINVQTTAHQVKMSDDTDVELRINTLERAISGNTTTRFCETIDERDALTSLIPGDYVVVRDATGDETVAKGGARYVWLPEGGGFRKVSEDEAMDNVCVWDHIEDRPEAGPAQIDMAVARQHSHENKAALDLIATDPAGNLTFNGVRPQDGRVWIAAVESVADMPENLAEGGLLIVNPAGGKA